MLLGIDHIVIVVNDLEQAAKDFEQLGFTVVPGGQHPVGSHNVLISFRDGSYIELIAFYREAADHRWWQPLRQGERLVDFCLQTNDLKGDTEKLRAAGVAINDPVPWSRTRPDGYELKWLLSLATGKHRGIAPFLIQDLTPRDERVPRQIGHANGVSGIARLILAVDDLATIERWYTAICGATGERVSDAKLHAKGRRYAIGPHAVDFMTPDDTRSPLTNWLRLHGPSPYAAILLGKSPAPATLDANLTHNANLIVES
jgi:catechol 2,3-dioxygenase-like lactoylglutathione lyase family enzyme